MKYILPVLSVILMSFIGDKKVSDNIANNQIKYAVLIDSSYVYFHAWNKHAPDLHFHDGKVRLQSGHWNNPAGTGEAIIDISSIYEANLDSVALEHLIGHLQSQDFFSLDSIGIEPPKFELTRSLKESIVGNLAINGITSKITIPGINIRMNRSFDTLHIKSDTFNLDMMPYQMPYFNQAKPSDEQHITVLNPYIKCQLFIVAVKQK